MTGLIEKPLPPRITLLYVKVNKGGIDQTQ
jgi:hypothetical protein